jgi:diguanylate cyclase (GGDEF)-like protein
VSKITRLKIGFAAGIIVMLANAIIPYQTFGWLSLANEAAESAQHILIATNDVLSAVKDAESSHRGYVLTGRGEFLKTYEGALRELRSQLARLHSLAAGRPELGPQLETLNGQAEDRVRQMERLIDLRRDQGLEPSARAAAEGKGRRIMDGLRATAREIIGAEQGRLAELRRERARRSAITAYALALVSFLDLLVLGIVYYLVFRTIAERARAEAELRSMGEQLKAGVETLAARNREMEIFHRMTDALQSCETTKETHDIIGKYGGQLFPGTTGALYVLQDSRDALEAVSSWGAERPRPTMFERDRCWALRRSQAHVMNDPASDVVCGHVDEGRGIAPYLCVPLMAQGEAIGLIHIEGRRGAGGQPERIGETMRVVAATLAEQASLSLSNVRLRETLRQQSITDTLTGLYNRRYLDETLPRELTRAERRRVPVAVIMLDVDHFKPFNDNYGHDAGDAVLRSLAALMQKHARGGDILCRYGGEEFAMIMPEMTAAIAAERAGRLCGAARLLSVHYDGHPLGRITISAGVAVFPEHAADASELLRAADAALYAAKQGGRDRVVVAGNAGPDSISHAAR